MGRRGKEYIWCPDEGRCVEVGSEAHLKMRRERYGVSPNIIVDEIPPTMSLATNEKRYFTSQKALERYDKEHGYVHTGGEVPGKSLGEFRAPKDPDGVMHAILDSENKLNWGMAPLTEHERWIAKQEQERNRE